MYIYDFVFSDSMTAFPVPRFAIEGPNLVPVEPPSSPPLPSPIIDPNSIARDVAAPLSSKLPMVKLVDEVREEETTSAPSVFVQLSSPRVAKLETVK